MPSCPFCSSEDYDTANKCIGCGDEIRESMKCPACKEEHTFTIRGGMLGCWNDDCPERIFSSQEEYDNY